MLARAWPCWAVVRRLVGNPSAMRALAGLLPVGVLACVLRSSLAGYFTLNLRHVVVAAACAAVLAIAACMR
jgi:hypothetical protein